MMLNISFDGLRTGIVQYLPFGLFIGMLILAELLLALVPWEFKDEAFTNLATPLDKSDSNSVALGKVIYTEYFFIFQSAGIILLIAMIGSIVLTLRKRPHVKRQNVISQIYRDPNDSIEVIDVKPGEGI